MALLKCKMCGGSLEVAAGETIIECEYCGTQQTLPKRSLIAQTCFVRRTSLIRLKRFMRKFLKPKKQRRRLIGALSFASLALNT